MQRVFGIKIQAAIFSIVIAICTSAYAQDTLVVKRNTITGKVINSQNNGLEDVFVYLLNANDSSLAKTAITNKEGVFTIEQVNAKNYFLYAQLLGSAATKHMPINIETDMVIPDIILDQSALQLNEVVVATKIPPIEVKNDRIILNIENTPSAAGNSVLDLLSKSPGVSVSQADNISMKGKQGVLVQIDGKNIPLGGTDLANMLRGLPAEAVEKIELITSTSARYDAASGAGIINIKLKKDKRMGTNGSVSGSYAQGVYPKFNGSINLNNRQKKLNIYANASHANREGFTDVAINRNFFNSGIYSGGYQQKNNLFIPYKAYSGRIGIDYTVSPKTSFGVLLSGFSSGFNSVGNNTSIVIDSLLRASSSFETISKTIENTNNYAANFNFKHVFDSVGTELTTDLDYAKYNSLSDPNFTTRYYDLNKTEFLPQYNLLGNSNGGLYIASLKADLVKPLANAYKIEMGVKATLVEADNDVRFYNKSSGVAIYDSTKSNHFIYNENINAGYVQLAKDWDKFSLQLGLRVENTNVKGNQLVYNSKFDTSYTQLFPSFSFTYGLSPKNDIGISFSRTINRPSYDQLNPFKFFLDPSTYKEGNPYLRPEQIYSYDLTHTFNKKIVTTFSFANTVQNITEVLLPSNTNQRVSIQTNRNLSSFEFYGITFSAPLEIKKWWTSINNGQLYYVHYFGNLANTPLSNGNVAWNINSTNIFTINTTTSVELTGNFRAREVYGYMTLWENGSLTIGGSKKIFKNNGTLKIAVSDVFYTAINRGDNNFANYNETFKVARDTRTVTIAFSYRFGKNQIAPPKRRASGAEDEKRRAAGKSNAG